MPQQFQYGRFAYRNPSYWMEKFSIYFKLSSKSKITRVWILREHRHIQIHNKGTYHDRYRASKRRRRHREVYPNGTAACASGN
ncbi:MAG: hypothetical protein EZS28_013954 [Streblomastix strix]|uniref:Uncharacterized protein n=1 Tax=Streblomastix strix TaxID=222440 RepID=A0A5J4W7I2_9EUKA|nr:MAG: hypothetical protein EZS28_013954 [Streblomastix strix]